MSKAVNQLTVGVFLFIGEPYGAESSILSSIRASQSMPASLADNCRNDNIVSLALRRLGVEVLDNYYEQAEELCQNVLVLLYTLMWKGLDGTAKSWKVRMGLFYTGYFLKHMCKKSKS